MSLTELIKRINANPGAELSQLSIEQLEELVKFADQNYYNEDISVFSDGVYDLLRERLERASRIGEVPYHRTPLTGRKVKLPYWMGSMDKAKADTSSLTNWLARNPGPYIISSKLDGVSALYTQRDGVHKLYTRGDGNIGQDISFLLKHFKLPRLSDKIMAVRAELIIPKTTFATKRFLRPNTGGTTSSSGKATDGKYYENSRNAVSGLVNSLEDRYNTELAEAVDFVAYESITNLKTQPQISTQLETLTEAGFLVVSHARYPKISETELSRLYDTVLQDSSYQIDGLILQTDRPYRRNTSGNPDYAVAFKKPLDDLVATTVIHQIRWEIGKDEILTPVAVIQPVKIDNVTISQVTAHNARRVVAGVLGPGAIIKVIRSGGVIPHIYEVLEPSDSGEPSLPDFAYVWTETGANIKLSQLGSNQSEELSGMRSGAKVSRIYHFLSTIGVEKVGEKTVTRIYNALKSEKGEEPTLNDFLRLTSDQVRFLGPKCSVTVVQNIRKAISQATPNLLVAASGLFGRGIGERKMDVVTDHIDDFWTRYPIPFDAGAIALNLRDVPGIADTSAKLISENYEKFYRFYLSIQDLVDSPQLNVPTTFTLDRLAKISGLFNDFRSCQLEQLLSNKLSSTIASTDVAMNSKDMDKFIQLWPTFSDWLQQLSQNYGNLMSPNVVRKSCPAMPVNSIPLTSTVERGAVERPAASKLMGSAGPLLVVLSDLKGKKKYEEMIQSFGGRIANSVTNATDIVVIGDASVNSGKRKKAEEKEIPVITLDVFIREYLTPVQADVSRSAERPDGAATRTKNVSVTVSGQREPAGSRRSPEVVVSGSFALKELEQMLSLERSTSERDRLVTTMHTLLDPYKLDAKEKHNVVKRVARTKLDLVDRVRRVFSDSQINLLLQNKTSKDRTQLLDKMNYILTEDVIRDGRQKVDILQRALKLDS